MIKNKYELSKYFYDVEDETMRMFIDRLIDKYGIGSILVEVNGKRRDKLTMKYLTKVDKELSNDNRKN